MTKLSDTKKGDEFKFGPRGMAWRVFHESGTKKRIIAVKNTNGTARIYSRDSKRWNREVLIQ